MAVGRIPHGNLRFIDFSQIGPGSQDGKTVKLPYAVQNANGNLQ